jgi:hypothetical protein
MPRLPGENPGPYEIAPEGTIPVRIAGVGLLLATLALGIFGIGRSLWMDEAWVANSVLAPSLSGMFYYPDWLQTTPPLFLLLTRGVIQALGPSNVAFRLLPLAFALVGVASMMAVARRLVSPPFAVAACAFLAFNPTAIEYSRTCKQYSAEMAASAAIVLCTSIYLRNPLRHRFFWLLGAFVVVLPLAWSTAFLLPGIALAVYAHSGIRRAGALVLIAGGVLAALYFAFIRQNLSPELRTFWIANAESRSPALLAALALCLAAAVRLIWTRAWMQFVALLPCLLLAAANALGLYPASPRTRLFALPCFLLVAALGAEDLSRWLTRGSRVPVFIGSLAWLVAAALASEAAWKQIGEHQNAPVEDFEGAVRYLRQHVASSDLLLVNASVIEGFKLYTAMDRWPDHHAIYADTGWPCCRREKASTRGTSTERVVDEDLDRKIPAGFSGRVWLLYSARHTHWMWAGPDEGVLWRSHLTERGCPPGPYYRVLPNLAISSMDCANAR